MAIRWRSFNLGFSLKAALAIVFTVSIAVLAASYRYLALDANAKYAIEALYEKDYVLSIKHKNEVVELFGTIADAARAKGKEARNARKALEHTPYWFLYETENGREFNYNNESLSLSTYPCLYEWNPDEGVKLGSDTNALVAEMDVAMPEGLQSVKVAYPRTPLERSRSEWESLHDKVIRLAILMAAGASASLLSLVWLMLLAGAAVPRGRRLLNEAKGTVTEVPIAVGLAAVGYWLYGNPRMWKGMGGKEGRILDFEQSVNAVGNGIVAGLCALLLLYSLLSLTEKLRDHTLLKRSLTSKFLLALWEEWKGILSGEAFCQCGLAKAEWSRLRSLLVLSATATLVLIGATAFRIVLLMALALLVLLVSLGAYWWGGYRRIKEYAKVDKQINDIYSGNYNTKNELDESSPYYEASKKMASIGDGIQGTLEEKIKSERMKIELVTNVSHDLKTPLTSIISYVDLLAREEDLSEEAREYVAVLMKKSARLKEIVSDVFELAKTTSGEIKVKMERIDFNKLVVQTLADMEDKITDMGLTVRTNVPTGPVFVKSDGKRLYRVLQNLIDNTLKYSLKGTRIYVDVNVEGRFAAIVVKNTSNYEMTFTKEDVLERFFRADRARTTEGSGLGISIAYAFVVACGGEMDVDIDGDMFKVTLKFIRDE